jgi:cell filamentation protein
MTGNMDPYVYPSTSVLRNRREIRDPSGLAAFEADATVRRLKELQANPVPGSFDAEHLRAIHRHIFQDVYTWAGHYLGELNAIHPFRDGNGRA